MAATCFLTSLVLTRATVIANKTAVLSLQIPVAYSNRSPATFIPINGHLSRKEPVLTPQRRSNSLAKNRYDGLTIPQPATSCSRAA
jgi:hypothetical protein